VDPEVAGSIPANGTIAFLLKSLILLTNSALAAACFALFWPFVLLIVIQMICRTMGRRREEHDPDRFLQRRGDRFHYCRRVPKELRDLDDRGAFVRRSLDTAGRLKARTARDLHEAADNALWAYLILGENPQAARIRYQRMDMGRSLEALGEAAHQVAFGDGHAASCFSILCDMRTNASYRTN
jgi:hypothetical protein